MKTFKTLTIFIIVILVSVLACKKEEDPTTIISNITTPTVNPTNQFFSDNIAAAIQSSTVDVSTWSMISGNKGSMVFLTPTSFVDASGNQVTGSIDIELIEALDNKDMLMLNRPTVTNNNELLTSAGIIYINATQNGEQLQIAEPLATMMPNITMGGNTNSPFLLFSGDTTANGDFVWVLDTGNVALDPDTGSYWQFAIDSVAWTNIDVISYPPGTPFTSGVDAILPSGHDGTNSSVFMYFSNINSVTSLYDGNQDGTFTKGQYYQLAVGESVKFVVVSEVNNQWSWHVTSTVSILDPHIETIPALTPAADEQAVQDAILNAL